MDDIIVRRKRKQIRKSQKKAADLLAGLVDKN